MESPADVKEDVKELTIYDKIKSEVELTLGIQMAKHKVSENLKLMCG